MMNGSFLGEDHKPLTKSQHALFPETQQLVLKLYVWMMNMDYSWARITKPPTKSQHAPLSVTQQLVYKSYKHG